MRRIVVFNRVSMDGFFAGPNGEIDWFIPDSDVDAALHKGNSAGGLILGRVTYQMFEAVWPAMAADPEAPEGMQQMGRELNEMTKYVFSTTLPSVTWLNSELHRGNVVEDVRRIKQSGEDGILIFGSGSVIQQLAPAGLIDEYWLGVTPIVLGAGKPLFAGVPRLDLKLLSSQAFESGNVLLHYRS